LHGAAVLDVFDSVGHPIGEAKDPAYFAGSLIVVDVLGHAHTTDGTDVALPIDEGVDLSGTNAVTTLQVVVTSTAIKAFECLFPASAYGRESLQRFGKLIRASCW
jgi:hypothetical protein